MLSAGGSAPLLAGKGAVTGRCVDYRSTSVLCCFPIPFKCFLLGHEDPPRWLLNALGTVWHHCRGLTCTYPTAWPGIVPTCQTAIEQVILLHPLCCSTRAQIERRECVFPTPPSEQRGHGGKRGHNRARITNQDVNHVSLLLLFGKNRIPVIILSTWATVKVHVWVTWLSAKRVTC